MASLNGKEITSQLAINTLKKALESHAKLKNKLILHSDQGSQDFTNFCKLIGVEQSMSKAGCPYDNAPMERYYNTLKNEFVHHHYFRNDIELNDGINNFAYVWYNRIRSHTFNGGLTPFEATYKN